MYALCIPVLGCDPSSCYIYPSDACASLDWPHHHDETATHQATRLIEAHFWQLIEILLVQGKEEYLRELLADEGIEGAEWFQTRCTRVIDRERICVLPSLRQYRLAGPHGHLSKVVYQTHRMRRCEAHRIMRGILSGSTIFFPTAQLCSKDVAPSLMKN